jgi:starch phosphorylase
MEAGNPGFEDDPLCGMPVPATSSLSASHEGHSYRFCSTFCLEAFRRDPLAVLRSPPIGRTAPDDRSIAYFSMEIALDEGMPSYSGGLGVLAGDTLRACADLRVPIVAVTLLYRSGYFRQRLDDQGGQHEEPSRWSLAEFLQPLAYTSTVIIEGRRVRVRAWRYDVAGRGGFAVPVLLLDTDLPDNDPIDRMLSEQLYAGDDLYRLAQEIVLGVGGVRLLAAAGYKGLRRYHLNEGHAALAPLELLRAGNADRPEATWRPEEVRSHCVFTTHTPVPAGHDRFEWGLVERTLGPMVPAAVLRMLGDHDGRLNMTSLALNLSGFVNGVAERHAEISRTMFPGYGIHHITNGVHSVTWTAEAFQRLFDRYLPGWRGDPAMLRNADRIPNEGLWEAHVAAKAALLAAVKERIGRALDPQALTIGFARRATEYKRADLVLSDPERLRALARAEGPMQLVFGGKAHPRDEPGKALIRRIHTAARQLGDEIPVVYLPDYDLALAKLMTSGSDLWLNTPRRPLEASGTSGMKAAHNGVPSLSVLDGWWIEGHIEGVTGWAIGPAITAPETDRAADLNDLYEKLERILRLFHRDRAAWVVVMRHAIALNASYFNTHRMVQQYIVNAYL